MDQEQRIAFAKTHNPGLLLWIGFYRAWIEYLLGDYDAAEKNCAGVEEIFDSGYGAMDASEVMLYLQLILLAQARRGKRGRLRKCRRLLRRLRAWSLHGPHSMLGKLFLVEAELAGCEGKPLLAKSKYISSILHLREEGMLGQEALANELLCNHCLRLGQEEDAVPYFHEACRLTEKWGAVVKLKYMHDKVGPLLL